MDSLLEATSMINSGGPVAYPSSETLDCPPLPDHRHVHSVACQHDILIQRLAVEADALASFVQKKANQPWVWIAMDAKTRQIIAFHVGDRSHTSADQLWAKI